MQCCMKNVVRAASAQLLLTLSLCRAVHIACSDVNIMSPVEQAVSLKV